MNNQTDGINWTDETWNPVSGCLHTCEYCYARTMYKRYGKSFDPAFHTNRLEQPLKLKQPRKVFVCSVADLFGHWVPIEWISKVVSIVKRCPQHQFQFLTKNPKRLSNFNPWPANAWVGATVDVKERLAPTLAALQQVDASVRFISFEPLNADMGMPDLSGIQWAIIGAQTGRKAHQPNPEWVRQLLQAADNAGCAVLFKDNLVWQPRREEFPIQVLAPVASLPYAQALLPL